MYLADRVHAHDTAMCTFTVTDAGSSPHGVSGTVSAAVTPHEADFIPLDGNTCRLSPTATAGQSRCSVTFHTDPFQSGYVPNGAITLTATYSGETVHDGSATSARIPVMTVYGCDFQGEGYTKVCDANGFVLIGGPRGKGGHTTSGTVKVGSARVTMTVPNDCVLTDPAARVRRLVRAAVAAWDAGQADRARDVIAQSLPLAQGEQRAPLLYVRGMIEAHVGSVREAPAIPLAAAEATTDTSL
jgi:hypothetical protein